MQSKKIYIAADHAGVELKSLVLNHFKDITWQDLGPYSLDSVDYPDFADQLCSAVVNDPGSMGVLVCGSGIGMCMRANKHKAIRAALCTSEELAELARQHNDANVLCLGARTVSENKNIRIIDTFLTTLFEAGRHQKRVEKIMSPTE